MSHEFTLTYLNGDSRDYILMAHNDAIVCTEKPLIGKASVAGIFSDALVAAESMLAETSPEALQSTIQEFWTAYENSNSDKMFDMGFSPCDRHDIDPAKAAVIAMRHIRNQAFKAEADAFDHAMIALEEGDYLTCIKRMREMENIDVSGLRQAKAVVDRISLAMMSRATMIVKVLTCMVKGEIPELDFGHRPGQDEFLAALKELVKAEKENS